MKIFLLLATLAAGRRSMALPAADKSLVFSKAIGLLFNGKAWQQFPKIEAACRGN